LQALVTLNDPVYLEAAQGLARRAVEEGGPSARAKAAHAVRAALCRPATDAELDRLVTLYEQEFAEFAGDPKAAEQLATDPIGPAPKGVDTAELAAWTTVANVLMNLDEFVTKH
jgi:hypothetical protein